MSTLLTSTKRGGRSCSLRNPSRFARSGPRVDAGAHVPEMRRRAVLAHPGSKSTTLIACFGVLMRSSVLSGAHMMGPGSLIPALGARAAKASRPPRRSKLAAGEKLKETSAMDVPVVRRHGGTPLVVDGCAEPPFLASGGWVCNILRQLKMTGVYVKNDMGDRHSLTDREGHRG